MKQLLTYVDASVVGGCYDEEFLVESRKFFELAGSGRFVLLVSDILVAELRLAPDPVKDVLLRLNPNCVTHVEATDESRRLRDHYLAARVLGRTHAVDAHHVALATISHADVIATWNFKHIVHFDKIRGFNAVNLREGYAPLAIHSPKELI